MSDAILDELTWRGQVAQTTNEAALRAALRSAPVSLYAGFDPTADSLHAGSLVPVMLLRRFQLAGHRPVALVGGATGHIGDPSGRSTERDLADPDLIASRVERTAAQLGRFLDFSPGRTGALLVNNLDWTASLSAIDFLREVGKHFSVNQMLAKESVATRLGSSGISFTEFSYLLLQAHDFLQLRRSHDVTLQVGGSDQWGNITAGLDLIRRVDGATAHGLTAPLLTNASGTKFGKSTGGGSVWLDAELTSPYAFHQYWLTTDDRDVISRLKTFSSLDAEQIAHLAQEVQTRPAARAAARALADDVTTLVHGAAETARATAAAAALFGRADLESLDAATLRAALAEIPRTELPAGQPLPPVAQLLAETGLADSRSAARRTIREGGAYLNNRKVTAEDAVPEPEDLLHGRFLVLRRGRQHVAGVVRGPA